MKQYGLSVSKLLGILHKPERKEKAIVPGLIAVMKTNKKFHNKTIPLIKEKKWQPPKVPGEIWIMYKDIKKQRENIRKIISAWRYPGITKPGEEIPIPDDIRQELLKEI